VINISQHVESVVKDQLAKACARLGVDKSEVGYAIGGHGQLTILVMPGGQQLAPAWVLLLTLRHKLLGREPIAGSLPIPGVLPSDADFRTVVDRVLGEIHQAREDDFNGKAPGDGRIDPSQVIEIPKGRQA